MAWYSCIGGGSEPSPWTQLFKYENLTFTSNTDVVITDVYYDVATLGGKKWRLEFKLHPYSQASYNSEYCFMQGGIARGQEWYIKRGVINYWDSSWNGAISESNPNDNDEWVIEFEQDALQPAGIGTIRTYKNGVLDKTLTNKNIGLLTSTPSQDTKIRLGEYQSSQYHFIGTFEYIKLLVEH